MFEKAERCLLRQGTPKQQAHVINRAAARLAHAGNLTRALELSTLAMKVARYVTPLSPPIVDALIHGSV